MRQVSQYYILDRDISTKGPFIYKKLKSDVSKISNVKKVILATSDKDSPDFANVIRLALKNYDITEFGFKNQLQMYDFFKEVVDSYYGRVEHPFILAPSLYEPFIIDVIKPVKRCLFSSKSVYFTLPVEHTMLLTIDKEENIRVSYFSRWRLKP